MLFGHIHEFAIVIPKYSILNGFDMKIYKRRDVLGIRQFKKFIPDMDVVQCANHYRDSFLEDDEKKDCVAYIPQHAASLIEAFKHNGYDVNPDDNPFISLFRRR